MIQGIHHVGLAVKDSDTVASFLSEVFGAQLVEGYELETPEFYSRLIRVGDGMFELLEPRGENGLIERFLNARGEGIHHVSLKVDDRDEFIKFCEAREMTILGRRFIHPKSAHGILIELMTEEG